MVTSPRAGWSAPSGQGKVCRVEKKKEEVEAEEEEKEKEEVEEEEKKNSI